MNESNDQDYLDFNDEEEGGDGKPTGPMISIFDQIEEMQFMSYEHGNKLKNLVDQIQLSIENDPSTFTDSNMQSNMIAHLEQLDHVKDVARDANNDFELIQESLRQFFDRMQEEVTKWKTRCQKLQ